MWIKKFRKRRKREQEAITWYKKPKVKKQMIVPRKSRKSGLELGTTVVDEVADALEDAKEKIENSLNKI